MGLAIAIGCCAGGAAVGFFALMWSCVKTSGRILFGAFTEDWVNAFSSGTHKGSSEDSGDNAQRMKDDAQNYAIQWQYDELTHRGISTEASPSYVGTGNSLK